MVLLSGRPGLLSGNLCGPHGSPQRCLTGGADHRTWAGGGVLFECEHLCLRVLDRHVFVVDGDILRPFPAQAEHKMSNTCLRTCAGSGRAFKGFIVQEVQKMLQKTWLHMKPSIHLNLTSIQPELAVLLRPAAPPPLSSSSLQPAAGLETE